MLKGRNTGPELLSAGIVGALTLAVVPAMLVLSQETLPGREVLQAGAGPSHIDTLKPAIRFPLAAVNSVQIKIDAAGFTPEEIALMKDNMRIALQEILTHIPELRDAYSPAHIAIIGGVSNLKGQWALLAQQSNNAPPIPADFQGFTATLLVAEGNVKLPRFATFVDAGALLDGPTALKVLNHELRHIKADLESFATTQEFETDQDRRESRACQETVGDLTRIRNAWIGEGVDTSLITGLQEAILDQQVVLMRFAPEKK